MHSFHNAGDLKNAEQMHRNLVHQFPGYPLEAPMHLTESWCGPSFSMQVTSKARSRCTATWCSNLLFGHL
jgi:hypothetical protein